jgi:hypothetical protein
MCIQSRNIFTCGHTSDIGPPNQCRYAEMKGVDCPPWMNDTDYPTSKHIPYDCVPCLVADDKNPDKYPKGKVSKFVHKVLGKDKK